MYMNIQKANMWKRTSAWLFDTILLAIVVVLLASFFSGLVNYDRHTQDLDAQYERYAQMYGVDFDMTQEEYNAMSREERQAFDDAYMALSSDPDALYSYNMLMRLTILIASLALLVGFLFLEFLIPLLLRNGQTLGKKIFSVALMRPDCIKVTAVSLFIRTILGKMAIETMIPLMMLFMMFWGTIGILGPAVLLVLCGGQLILVAVNRHNRSIHDLLANTVAVELSSQLIFDSEEHLIEYKKKYYADKASKQVY